MLHSSPAFFSVLLASLLRGSLDKCSIQQGEEGQACVSNTVFLASPDNLVFLFAHSVASFSTCMYY